jgi:hypothetical protein
MSNDIKVIQIERRPAPTSREQFKREVEEPSRPVVLTGGMESWPALSRWNAEYLRERIGQRNITVDICPPTGDATQTRAQEMTLAQYIEKGVPELEARDRMSNTELSLHDFPEVKDDAREPDYYAPERFKTASLFLGQATMSALHYHPDAEALLCMVHGQNRVALYEPGQVERMYPTPWNRSRFHWSQVNTAKPDLTRHPRFAEAQRWETLLSPGEMVFIPIHWWHAIYRTAFTAAVTWFWMAEFRKWHFPSPGVRTVAAFVPAMWRGMTRRGA